VQLSCTGWNLLLLRKTAEEPLKFHVHGKNRRVAMGRTVLDEDVHPFLRLSNSQPERRRPDVDEALTRLHVGKPRPSRRGPSRSKSIPRTALARQAGTPKVRVRYESPCKGTDSTH